MTRQEAITEFENNFGIVLNEKEKMVFNFAYRKGQEAAKEEVETKSVNDEVKKVIDVTIERFSIWNNTLQEFKALVEFLETELDLKVSVKDLSETFGDNKFKLIIKGDKNGVNNFINSLIKEGYIKKEVIK